MEGDRAEQDPEQWRLAVAALIRRATSEEPKEAAAIDAIGLTGAMRSFVLVDKGNNPLGPAILFQDRRADAQFEHIQSEISAARLLSLTGQRLSPRSVPARLRWIAENEPDRLKETCCILAPKDFIRLYLTGQAATDPTDAAAFQLYSVRERKWHDALCTCASISPELLPEVRNSAEIAGRLSPVRAMTLGLRSGIPVVVGAGEDAAFLSSGVSAPNEASEHLAGSGSLRVMTERLIISPTGGLEAGPAPVANSHVIGGTVLTAGIAIDWFLRNCSAIPPDADMTAELSRLLREIAERKEISEALFFPHLAGATSPRWAPNSRGAFMGLSLSHTSTDIFAAVIEGIAYSLQDIAMGMESLGVEIERVCAMGRLGRQELLAGIRADVYNKPIRMYDEVDPACYSAMLIAATAVGTFSNPLEANRKLRKLLWEVEPNRESAERYRIGFAGYRAAVAELNKLWNPAAGR